MGRPKTPTNILELKGASKKNPQRKRAAEPRDERAVRRITGALDTEKKAYDSITKAATPGTLCRSDSLVVWLAAKLIVRINTDDYSTGDVAQLIRLLVQMGMTQSARAGLSVPEPPKPNRFAED